MKLADLKLKLQNVPQTWIVTGCAGFIGCHLVEQLLLANQKVIGIDNFVTGSRENLELVKGQVSPEQYSNFKLMEMDIVDLEYSEEFADAHFILHHAAQASVPHSIENPMYTFKTNIEGTEKVFELARRGKMKKVVYASSSAVYGDDPADQKLEDVIGKPLSPYANSKFINERQALQLSAVYGVPTVGLRYFNVFGPRQNPNGPYAAVIPAWMSCLEKEESVTVNGAGDNTRDFIHVLDVVKMNLLSALFEQEDQQSHVFNVAGGTAINLLELFNGMSEAWKKVDPEKNISPPTHGPEREGDIKHSLGDISKAKSELHFEPEVGLTEGLEEMVRQI